MRFLGKYLTRHFMGRIYTALTLSRLDKYHCCDESSTEAAIVNRRFCRNDLLPYLNRKFARWVQPSLSCMTN